MSKAYVVMGTTGEWDDFREWPVKAFAHEGKAHLHALRASQRARELQLKNDDLDDDFLFCMDGNTSPETTNEYDPEMALTYTGTKYFVVELPFEE